MSALHLDHPSIRRPGIGPDTAALRRLRAVAASEPKAKPRLVYAVTALVAIGVIVAAQLVLSIALTQGAYEIDGYLLRQDALALEQQKLADDLDRVESPQFLAANAEALGMVPNASPVYLRLSDGAVLGEPVAAAAGAAPSTPLVPNELIAGVPLVTDQAASDAAPTDAAAAPPAEGQTADAAAPAAPAPAAPASGLPTPATH